MASSSGTMAAGRWWAFLEDEDADEYSGVSAVGEPPGELLGGFGEGFAPAAFRGSLFLLCRRKVRLR